MDRVYSSIEILESLKAKYGDYLKPNIVSVEMGQDEEVVQLIITEIEKINGGLEKRKVNTMDLNFITDGDYEEDLYFDPINSIEKNVDRLINDFGAYSIVMTMDLFTNEAADKINREYHESLE